MGARKREGKDIGTKRLANNAPWTPLASAAKTFLFYIYGKSSTITTHQHAAHTKTDVEPQEIRT